MSEQHYKAVIAARSVLADLPESKISEKTAAGYRREYLRLLTVGGKKTSGVLDAAQDTTAASTWYRRRAAIIYEIRTELTNTLKEQDRLQRIFKTTNDPVAFETWKRLVERTVQFVKMLPKVMAIKNWPPLDERKRRETKKRSLNGLPDDWRQLLAKRLPKYRLPFLVAAATGCRPAELVTGIALSYDTDLKTGIVSIKAVIKGAKVREMTGQPDRSIFIALDDRPDSLAGQLQESLKNGPINVGLTDEKLFSGAVRDAARREWPKRKVDLSAYSLRHQFAGDLKAAGWKDEKIAEAMGHVTTKTASYYGDRKQGRGGLVIDGVEASRKVKKPKKKIK